MPWPEDLTTTTLAPQDPGLRLIGPALQLHEGMLGAYPLIRWTDRWGTRWEYRRGQVRPIHDSDKWVP